MIPQGRGLKPEVLTASAPERPIREDLRVHRIVSLHFLLARPLERRVHGRRLEFQLVLVKLGSTAVFSGLVEHACPSPVLLYDHVVKHLLLLGVLLHGFKDARLIRRLYHSFVVRVHFLFSWILLLNKIWAA